MFKRLAVVITLFVLLVGILVLVTMRNMAKGMAMGALMAPQPTAVSTLKVEPQSWQPVLSAVGTLRSVNGTTLSTDLAGIVSKIQFESGASVKKGDLVLELDTQQEQAQLQAEQAKFDLAKLEIARKRDLMAKNAIAKADIDTAETTLRQSEAMVLSAKALIARKRIVAPFDGVIGIRQVSPGQYLNPGAMIAPLQSFDPIYVEFSLPQQHLASLDLGKKLHVRATGVEAQFDGEITAIDSRVDESTRNIVVQGTIANPERKLRSGMFVNVEVQLPTQEGVLAIPSSAISYATYGDSVFVVKEGKTPDGKVQNIVQQVTVRLGQTRGDQVAVVSGLKPGDVISTGGVFRLQNGAPVQVNNSVQPGNELDPKPPES
ncbi:MAG TPA: efflux RND transporter periplasmic adaptor subunit [Chthoniobacteraceae bacterium]|jgi:membrane fusion protein (multidrug efflux system)|nr:efflux RND transporter periplasmic adaptor subunit [Chthoniobacteraceae bacterium]